MPAFFALVRLNFIALISTTLSVGGRNKKRKAVSSSVGLLFLVGMMVFVAGTYSFSMGMAYNAMGVLELLPKTIVAMGLFFSLALTMYSAQAHIFSVKDIDLILSLPVSHFVVMLSKVLSLYLEILLINSIFALASGITYALFGGSVVVGFLLLVAGIFLSFIPTTLALVLGFVVSFIMSKVRNKSLAGIIMNMAMVIVIFIFSFSSSFNASSDQVDVEGMSELFTKYLLPVEWAGNFAMDVNILQFVLLVFCSLSPFLLVAWLFSRFYKNILSGLVGSGYKNTYKIKTTDMVSRSGFSALIGKEIARFVGSPIYFTNAGIGIIMMLFAGVAAVIFKSKIMEITMLLSADIGMDIGYGISSFLLLTIAFMAFMVLPASVAISLEGNSFWILKTLPLDVFAILWSKIIFSFALSGGGITITTLLLGYAFSLSILDVAVILVFELLVAFFLSSLCLLINLLLPKMDATNDAAVVKQSASAVVSMFSTWLIMGLFVGLFFLLGANFYLFSAVGMVLSAALAGLIVLLLNTKGRKLFAGI